MPDLSRRADLDQVTELMDGPCSYEELRACLRDIAKVNRLTFAYGPTLNFLARATERRIADEASGAYSTIDSGPIRIVDVGCGYGDMLRRIERWAAARELEVTLTGVDLNPDVIRAAREATSASSRIEWIAGDCYSYPAEDTDIVLSSLLTHHLREDEIVRYLQWMEATARRGWFVNDLHRQAIPYWVFTGVAAVAGWHPFVRHDGPVSIQRSFITEDWQRMCAEAGLTVSTEPSGNAKNSNIKEAAIVEYWPARLCVERLK
jgi:SAM-dependent methyltransferase